MPDDIAAHMLARGAQPVTIRAPLYDAETGLERMQRAAAYRQPMDHPDAPKIDRLHAAGHLDARQYANACAVLRLMRVVERSKGVAEILRDRGSPSGDDAGPEDEWRRLIERGGVGMQALCMLLRDEALGPYMFGRARAYLDTLDWIVASWDGERWRGE